MKRLKRLFIIAIILVTSLIAACSKSNNDNLSEVNEDNLVEGLLDSNTDSDLDTQKDLDTERDLNTKPDSDDKGDTSMAFNKVDVSAVTYEAEDGIFSGKVKKESKKKGYSGKGYVTGFEGDNDSLAITIEISEEGFYDLEINAFSMGGYKENIIYVDGVNLGNIVTESDDFELTIFPRVYLTKGTHTVELKKSWGWIGIDYMKVLGSEALDSTAYRVSKDLVNANADENTRRLMSFLVDNYGTNILSGQYSDKGVVGMEMQSIYRNTGKRPAVLGLDMMDYTPSRVENGATPKAVEYALQYYNDYNGIVTFCWHWNAPTEYHTGIWWRAFYTEATNIDLEKIMNGKDEIGYELLLRDIDAIAEQLKVLESQGVPILWRPLHEASGGWFWWGAKGADAFKKLWVLMYERMTDYHELNNLIWIWNGQDKEWYPGDEYVDIIGEDIYPGERVYASQMARFLKAADYTDSNKMIVLSENGCLVDPDLSIRDGAMWGFFATWSGEFVLIDSNMNAYSEKYTEEYMLKKVYEHQNVLTLDELPDLKNYPIE